VALGTKVISCYSEAKKRMRISLFKLGGEILRQQVESRFVRAGQPQLVSLAVPQVFVRIPDENTAAIRPLPVKWAGQKGRAPAHGVGGHGEIGNATGEQGLRRRPRQAVDVTLDGGIYCGAESFPIFSHGLQSCDEFGEGDLFGELEVAPRDL